MIGTIVNNYEVKALLGEGGMGSVYLAEHPYMGRKAAVKVLHRVFTGDAGLVARFMNEARAANAVKHPNIIDIIDVGILPNGLPYLMMEFLDGESLATRLQRMGRLAPSMALDIVKQMAAALGATHTAGIVHRDLKPDNLFLVKDSTIPGAERVKVLDFGIAKLRGDMGNGSKTSTGMLMGTPAYMSPEQCRGLSSEIDRRTDVYATGVILYEMLCGAPPFQSEGAGEILMMHATTPPDPPRNRNPEIPAHIEAAILKALAKSPALRFPDMDAFFVALDVGASFAIQSSETLLQPRPAVPVTRRQTVGQTTTFRSNAAELTPRPDGGRGQKNLIVAGVAAFVVSAAVVAGIFARRPPPTTAMQKVPVSVSQTPVVVMPPAPVPSVIPMAVPAAPPVVQEAISPPAALVHETRAPKIPAGAPRRATSANPPASLRLSPEPREPALKAPVSAKPPVAPNVPDVLDPKKGVPLAAPKRKPVRW